MYGVQFNAGASRSALRKAMELMDDMTPVYRDIGEYMIDATRQRFARGEAPDGSKWPAKSEATLERYKRLGYGTLARTKTLVNSGRLFTEILQWVSRDGVVVGSSLIYSGVMQDGAAKGTFGTNSRGRPIPWGRIPARTWLGISRDDETAIVKIVDEHMVRRLNAQD